MRHPLLGTLLLAMLFGCGRGEEPPPPPPPTTTTTVPEPPPPDPPPPDNRADPRDYVSMERVDGIIDGTAAQVGLLHGLTFGGWRDPIYVADHCPWAAGFLGFVAPEEMRAFGELGAGLTREGEDFVVPQLRKPNRRCDPDGPNHDPRFLRSDGTCGQSEMRKTRLAEFRSRLDPHMDVVDDTTARAAACQSDLLRRDPDTGAYDSIRGWCDVMNRLGLRECGP